MHSPLRFLAFCLLLPSIVTAQLTEATWIEESATKTRDGQVQRYCSVSSVRNSQWRSEIVQSNGDIAIVIAAQNAQPAIAGNLPFPASRPIQTVRELLEAVRGPAKFEMVDIMAGVGYSRYKQQDTSGRTRTIWMDRTTGFPRRVHTQEANGSSQEQNFRLITVDESIQRRLFDPSTLYPFFSHYLDDWHARLRK